MHHKTFKKRPVSKILALFLFLSFALLPAEAFSDNNYSNSEKYLLDTTDYSTKQPDVFSIKLGNEIGHFIAYIPLSNQFTYKTMKLTNPSRLVIDFYGATFEQGFEMFDVKSLKTSVQRMKVSQFSSEPNIVRIVLETNKPDTITIERSDIYDVYILSEGKSIDSEVAPVPSIPAVPVLKSPKTVILSDRIEINISSNNKVNFESNLLKYPPAIAVDIYGTSSEEENQILEVNEGLVRSVRTAYNNDRPNVTRFYIDCNLIPKYMINQHPDGAGVKVTIFQPSVYNKKIVLDAGHGGKDPGAKGKNGLNEKMINLNITLKLADFLRRSGAKVYLTRDRDNFIKLDDRAYISNNILPDVFISIHSNSNPAKPSRRGTETYYFSDNSFDLARTVQNQMSQMLSIGDNGLRKARFVVLRKNQAKSILCEIAYLSNINDLTLLGNDIFIENASRGIYNGLESYFGFRGFALNPLKLSAQLLALLPETPAYTVYDSPNLVLDYTTSPYIEATGEGPRSTYVEDYPTLENQNQKSTMEKDYLKTDMLKATPKSF